MIGINLGPTITYLQSGSPELELGFLAWLSVWAGWNNSYKPILIHQSNVQFGRKGFWGFGVLGFWGKFFE